MASLRTRTWLSLWIYVLSIIGQTVCSYIRPTACLDSTYAIQGQTMCIDNRHGHPIHPADRSSITQIHNDVRAAVNPKASNLLDLTYVTILEIEAQVWAEQCHLDHDEVHLRAIPGRYRVGQNILMSSNPLTWQQVVDEWVQEKRNFNYGQNNDIKLVGNYTQLISAESTAFGCGMSLCGGVYFYVCNYAPSDLASRINHPYNVSTSGQGADDCPLHVSNSSMSMCDCDGLICLNGGSVDLATCKCICPKDDSNMRYKSDYCELTCKPSTDPASCQTKDRVDCQTDAEVFLACPWKCYACPYSGENYTQGAATMPWTTTVPTTTTTTTAAAISTNIPFRGALTASPDAATTSATIPTNISISSPSTASPDAATTSATIPTNISISSLSTASPDAATTSATIPTNISISSPSPHAITTTPKTSSMTTQAPSGNGLAHSQQRNNSGTRCSLKCFALILVLEVLLILSA